jgi:GTP1/Obg family GTP-binding protein
MGKTLLFDVNEVSNLFSQNRVFELRGIGKRLIREAAIENNYAKAELAVIAYALHKLETKEHIATNKKWLNVKNRIIKNFGESIQALKVNNKEDFFQQLKEVILDIQKLDSSLGNYAQSLYEKSKVKQASQAYSYGLSISQSAELTGANKKELQSYIGFTKMNDEEPEMKTIRKRVKELKELLRHE